MGAEFGVEPSGGAGSGVSPSVGLVGYWPMAEGGTSALSGAKGALVGGDQN